MFVTVNTKYCVYTIFVMFIIHLNKRFHILVQIVHYALPSNGNLNVDFARRQHSITKYKYHFNNSSMFFEDPLPYKI